MNRYQSKVSKCFLIILALCFMTSLSQEIKVNTNNYLTLSLKNATTMLFKWRNTNSKNGWVSIGIGGYLMDKVDVHVILWKVGTTPYSFSDLWSRDYDTPSEDVFEGGKNDLVFENYIVDSNGDRILTYSRALNTGDSFDNQIVEGDNALVTAWSPFDSFMTKHGSYVGVGNFNVNISSLSVATSMGYYGTWEFHGIILMIVWCILNTFAYVTIRLFKHICLGNYFHRICGFINTILTIVVGFIGLAKSVEGPSDDYANLQIHLIVGLISIGCAAVLLISGIIVGVMIYGKRLESPFLFKVKSFHKLVGHVITYLSLVVIITGGWLLWQD